MGDHHTGDTKSASGWGETEIKGTHEGNLLAGTFTNSQIDQLNNYHRHMNIG